MSTFSKILYSLAVASIIVGFTIDFALSNPINLWKASCLVWIGAAWLAEARADKLEKKLNDFNDGSNK